MDIVNLIDSVKAKYFLFNFDIQLNQRVDLTLSFNEIENIGGLKPSS